jgi:hypothetical protein
MDRYRQSTNSLGKGESTGDHSTVLSPGRYWG